MSMRLVLHILSGHMHFGPGSPGIHIFLSTFFFFFFLLTTRKQKMPAGGIVIWSTSNCFNYWILRELNYETKKLHPASNFFCTAKKLSGIIIFLRILRKVGHLNIASWHILLGTFTDKNSATNRSKDGRNQTWQCDSGDSAESRSQECRSFSQPLCAPECTCPQQAVAGVVSCSGRHAIKLRLSECKSLTAK